MSAGLSINHEFVSVQGRQSYRWLSEEPSAQVTDVSRRRQAAESMLRNVNSSMGHE